MAMGAMENVTVKEARGPPASEGGSLHSKLKLTTTMDIMTTERVP